MDLSLTFGETVMSMFSVAILFVLIGIYWEIKKGAQKTPE